MLYCPDEFIRIDWLGEKFQAAQPEGPDVDLVVDDVCGGYQDKSEKVEIAV